MKTTTILLSLLTLPTLFFAQTADDAYRFSQTHVTGSSRNQALGGAMGALGVDVSNAATNPAGLGIATKGEFYFTPAFYNTNTDAKYLGNTESASRFKVGLNSLGLNLVSANYKRGDEYKRIGLSFSINNMARFNETRSLSGLNTGPAYVDLIVNRLNAGSFTTNFDAFKDDLFFKSGRAFDTVPITDTATLKAVGNYISNFGNGRAINQNIVENISGYINSFDVSLFGTPNSDKLYLGVSLGLPILRYQNNFTLVDEDKLPNKGLSYSSPLKSYEYNILTNTDGSGLNLKLGVLYRATDFLRIGGYIHTPTVYTLSETYSSALKTRLYDAIQDKNSASPNDSYTYTVVTPFKAGLNLGFIISKYAAIGIDYETIGYNQASLRESNSSNSNINIYKNENNAIKQNLERTENIRAGLEVNIKPVKLRVGYNVLGTGITNTSNSSKYNQQVSGGVGFSEGKWYFDAAVTKSTSNYNYSAYQYAPLAKINKTAVTGSLTVGVRF
jgi:hypothetical protein